MRPDRGTSSEPAPAPSRSAGRPSARCAARGRGGATTRSHRAGPEKDHPCPQLTEGPATAGSRSGSTPMRPIAASRSSAWGSVRMRKWSGLGQLKPVPWTTWIFSRSSRSRTNRSSSWIDAQVDARERVGRLGLDAGDAGDLVRLLPRPRPAVRAAVRRGPSVRGWTGGRRARPGWRTGRARWRTGAWRPAWSGPPGSPSRAASARSPPASRSGSPPPGTSWTGRRRSAPPGRARDAAEWCTASSYRIWS
ncbi:hypothetical protein SVIOM342S_02749 [Streptomyces violaceorubidus]